MKKIFLVGTLALACTASLADSLFHGAYVGVGAGANIAHHASNSFSFIHATDSDLNNNFTPSLSSSALAFNFLAGYAWKIQCWHLGAEIDYILGNSNTKFNQSTGQPVLNNPFVTVKTSGALGAGFRVGYHWDRLLGFVRLGVENRTFRMNGNVMLLTAAVPGNTLTANARKTAFVPGIGVQINLNKNISTTLEYRMAFYGTINKKLRSPIVGSEGETIFRVKPRISTLLASLRYHF
ncbi:MAG: outer membrane protein [Candidatus Paracaedibacter sp.]